MGLQFRPRFYAWIILFACGAFFLQRGAIRAMADPALNMDAPLLLIAAETWRRGGNPYDVTSIAGNFRDRIASVSSTLERGAQAFVYSPPAYTFLSSLTYLPWSLQRGAWNLLNSVMLVISFALVCGIFKIPLQSLRGFALVSLGLLANPGHVNIAFGQTGAIVLVLMCISWYLAPLGESVPYERTAGSILAMAVAVLIKPQIVLIFMVCDLWMGRRRAVLGAVAVAASLFVAALALHGDIVRITSSWLHNMHAFMQDDGNPINPLDHSAPRQMINLQSPLAVLTGSSSVSTALAIGACVLMGWLYAWIDRGAFAPKVSSQTKWLGALSAAAILMLLIFYHRIYDAVFLIVPAAFAIQHIAVRDWRGWALLALLVPLWVPISSTMYRVLYPSVVTADETHVTGPIIYGLLIQHQTWFLVAAFFLLCEIRRKSPRLQQGEFDPRHIGPVSADPRREKVYMIGPPCS